MGADHTLSNAVKAVQKMFGAESYPDVKELEKLRKTLVQKIEGGGRKTEVYYGEDDDEDVRTPGGPMTATTMTSGMTPGGQLRKIKTMPMKRMKMEGKAFHKRPIEQMADQTDELLVTWLESRKKMAEYAKSQGFYPVVAIPPEVLRLSLAVVESLLEKEKENVESLLERRARPLDHFPKDLVALEKESKLHFHRDLPQVALRSSTAQGLRE